MPRGRKPRPLSVRLFAKVDKNGPIHSVHGQCWVWTGWQEKSGHGKIAIGGTRSRMIGSHRASWIVSVGPIPDDICVLHKCDNPPCVRPEHLFLGTLADNTADMVAKDRHRSLCGEDSGTAKLTESQVQEIRMRAGSGSERQKDIARDFGIIQAHVSRIHRKVSWGKTTKPPNPKEKGNENGNGSTSTSGHEADDASTEAGRQQGGCEAWDRHPSEASSG